MAVRSQFSDWPRLLSYPIRMLVIRSSVKMQGSLHFMKIRSQSQQIARKVYCCKCQLEIKRCLFTHCTNPSEKCIVSRDVNTT